MDLQKNKDNHDLKILLQTGVSIANLACLFEFALYKCTFWSVYCSLLVQKSHVYRACLPKSRMSSGAWPTEIVDFHSLILPIVALKIAHFVDMPKIQLNLSLRLVFSSVGAHSSPHPYEKTRLRRTLSVKS